MNPPEPNIPPIEEEKKYREGAAMRLMRFAIEILKFASIALLIVLPVRFFVAQPYIVSGVSMEPNISFSDYLVVDKISYRFSTPERGDVVVFRYPLDSSVIFVKRIVGLPGETVKVGEQGITIVQSNREFLLNEPYVEASLASSTVFKVDEVTLAADEYFVLGDNRTHSSDSREWGPLRERYLIGKAFARLFPAKSFSLFPGAFTHSQ